MFRILIVCLTLVLGSSAWAAGGVVTDPAGVAPDRYVYYPGTEALAEDEIRLTACGTGMPAARHKQAATCFLAEFGNGDKLIFDIGTGSMANLAAYMIPYEYLDKIFLSHLHTDHMGDLDALWAGGFTAGRPAGIKIWGPSGLHPELGTKAAIKGFKDFVAWDHETRSSQINPAVGEIEVTEFDYRAENQVVYDEDGVVVKSFPAIHTGDGPVSFIIEYAVSSMKTLTARMTTLAPSPALTSAKSRRARSIRLGRRPPFMGVSLVVRAVGPSACR